MKPGSLMPRLNRAILSKKRKEALLSNCLRARIRTGSLSAPSEPLRPRFQVQHARPAGHRMLRWTNDQAPQRRGTWRDFVGASAQSEPWGDRLVAGVPRLDDRAGTAARPSGSRPRPAVLRAAWRGPISGAPKAVRTTSQDGLWRLASGLCAEQVDPQSLVSGADCGRAQDPLSHLQQNARLHCRRGLEGFTRQMKRLPPLLRRFMTYDRGSGMACHPELARRLKTGIWFCDPHTRWPRASNESTNGQIAPFLHQRHRPWAPSARTN